MDYENMLLEKEDHIAILTFNRPDARNAVNNQVRAEFAAAIEEIEADDDIRVMILTGKGKAFASGVDIKEFNQTKPYHAHTLIRLGERVEKLSKPVIAAVNGFCLGGGNEIALGCDIIIASEKAKFGQPELNIGIIPGGGATQRLPRLIGPCKAKELIFTSDIVTAQEALGMGMINQVVPDEELLDKAREMAKKIAKKSPASLKLAKQAVNFSMQSSLECGLKFEYELYSLSLGLEDKFEGVAAFVEKRAPNFVGR